MKSAKDTAPVVEGNPSQADFDAAVRRIEDRGGKLTVRGIHAITRGTMAVVTRRLRELRERRAAELEELPISEDVLLAIKQLIKSAQTSTDRIWRDRQQQERDASDELEGLLTEAEERLARVGSGAKHAKDALTKETALHAREAHAHDETKRQLKDALDQLGKSKASEAQLDADRQAARAVAQASEAAHEDTKRQLKDALEELDKSRAREAQLDAERRAAVAVAEARGHDQGVLMKRLDAFAEQLSERRRENPGTPSVPSPMPGPGQPPSQSGTQLHEARQ